MRAVVRGAGSIGTRHAEVLRTLGLEVMLWPVRTRPDPARGTFSGAEEDGLRLYRDADLVVVATDTARHVADALEALDHGARRVLVEKPIAANAPDADMLARHPRCDAVAVAAPLRAHEGFRSVARAVHALPGRLSVAVYCQSWLPEWRPATDYRNSYSARASEGGVLRDLVHEIDYSILLFGTPQLVGAALDHDGPLDIAAEQAASLLWVTERATVSVRLDYISRPAARGLVVRSASGSVEWDVAESTVTLLDRSGAQARSEFERDRDRNAVMATQATALLDCERLEDVEPSTRLITGAPATLAEGIAAITLCDQARSHHRTNSTWSPRD